MHTPARMQGRAPPNRFQSAATERVRRTLQSARRTAVEDGPLVVACAGIVALGLWLRMVDLGFPRSLTWDEHHFVLNAQNYLKHEHDWNDHPPLGKLLIVLGMLVYGDTSIGWRYTPMICGIVSVVLACAVAVRLFRDRRAGLVAAAFVAGDGFLISYSRTALLDGMLATFGLASLWLTLRARSYRGVAWAGLVVGCAANIKLSGAFYALPIVGLCALRPDPIRRIATLAVAPVVYTALFMFGLALSREPHGVMDAMRATAVIVAHHAALTSFTHPMTSRWYTWFIPTRPVTLRYDAIGMGRIRAMTSLGNPALWWAADVALAVALWFSAVAAVRFFRDRRRNVHVGRLARSNVVLFGFAFAMLAPWIFGRRDSYIYHYLPTYAFLLVLLAGDVAAIYRRRRLPALVFVLAIGLVSVYYAPVWAQLPITPAAFRSRLFLKTWL